jgi:hypothetical protein
MQHQDVLPTTRDVDSGGVQNFLEGHSEFSLIGFNARTSKPESVEVSLLDEDIVDTLVLVSQMSRVSPDYCLCLCTQAIVPTLSGSP